MPEQLGQYLKKLRKMRGFSLRHVERESGVSNAYLSQLETGKITRPSPEILHKLAIVYQTSYPHLLILAGHPVPQTHDLAARELLIHHRSESKTNHESLLLENLAQLTDEERERVADYIDFLRSRRKEEK